MVKPGHPLSHACRIATVAACKIAVATVVIGIWLSAWPVHAQVERRDSSWLPPWQRPPSPSTRDGTQPVVEQRAVAASGKRTASSKDSSGGNVRRTSFDATPRAARAISQERTDEEPQRPGARAADRGYTPGPDNVGVESNEDWLSFDPGLAECNPGSCGPREPCISPFRGHVWVRGEYLLWWTKGSGLPPLVTTSPAGTSSETAGVLGQSTTRILFGDSTVNATARSGGRFQLGYWFDSSWHCAGIEASYLWLGNEATRFSAASTDIPILARPYYDTQLGTQAAMLIAHPDFLSGSVNVDTTSDFQAAEVLFRKNLFQRQRDKMDFLVGWRYAQLDERLRIGQSSLWTAPQGLIIAGTTKSLFDLFDAENQFNGAVLGLVYQEHVGRWSLETLVKLGLGNTHSRVIVDGSTTTTVPNGGTAVFAGGLLAQQTNIGQYEQDEFAVIPEVGVTLGYDITCQLRATFGYNLIYWNRVARPANQLDTNVSQLPPEDPTGDRRPAFPFAISDFCAQGLNFGLEYRF